MGQARNRREDAHMSRVRVCKEPGCHVILSYYNPTNYCCLHPHVPRRMMAELKGDRVLADDFYARKKYKDFPPKEILTWRSHMLSDRFLAGEPDRLTAKDKKAYESGEWLG
jgi:hypothetical protein